MTESSWSSLLPPFSLLILDAPGLRQLLQDAVGETSIDFWFHSIFILGTFLEWGGRQWIFKYLHNLCCLRPECAILYIVALYPSWLRAIGSKLLCPLRCSKFCFSSDPEAFRLFSILHVLAHNFIQIFWTNLGPSGLSCRSDCYSSSCQGP